MLPGENDTLHVKIEKRVALLVRADGTQVQYDLPERFAVSVVDGKLNFFVMNDIPTSQGETVGLRSLE